MATALCHTGLMKGREAAAPAQVTSRDMGEEVQGLPAARTPTEEQVMEEEEESSFLPLSSPLNKRATSSCSGNFSSDCQSSGAARRDSVLLWEKPFGFHTSCSLEALRAAHRLFAERLPRSCY